MKTKNKGCIRVNQNYDKNNIKNNKINFTEEQEQINIAISNSNKENNKEKHTLLDENLKKILPSKFIKIDEIIEVKKEISNNNNIMVYINKIKRPERFCCYTMALANIMLKLSPLAKDIVQFVILNMEYGVNTIVFDYDDFYIRRPCNKIKFYKAIEELIENNILEKYYNRRKVYGINYNYISFGDYTEFINNYVDKFFRNNKKINIIDNKIVIPDDIYNAFMNAVKQSRNKKNNKYQIVITDKEDNKNKIETNIINVDIKDITKTITEEQLKAMKAMVI